MRGTGIQGPAIGPGIEIIETDKISNIHGVRRLPFVYEECPSPFAARQGGERLNLVQVRCLASEGARK